MVTFTQGFVSDVRLQCDQTTLWREFCSDLIICIHGTLPAPEQT